MPVITKDDLNARTQNVNRRLRPEGVSAIDHRASGGRYVLHEYRNGAVALDEYRGTSCIRTITVGTKREIYDFLHAMMVGIDLSRADDVPDPEALGIDTTKAGWFAEYQRRTKR